MKSFKYSLKSIEIVFVFVFLHIEIEFFFSFQGDGFIQYKEFRDYFGEDLLTSDANTVDLTSLFNEIDTNHCGSISVDQLLAFFNRYSTMISKEEAEIFLGMISDVGNENRITLKEFLKAMQEWKI